MVSGVSPNGLCGSVTSWNVLVLLKLIIQRNIGYLQETGDVVPELVCVECSTKKTYGISGGDVLTKFLQRCHSSVCAEDARCIVAAAARADRSRTSVLDSI